MAVTSKSPHAVVRTALAMARWALPAYAHACSPKKFTQHQLFACLVLKNFLKTDYRGLAAHLTDHPVLTQTVLELCCVPHYTTFQKACAPVAGLAQGATTAGSLDSDAIRPSATGEILGDRLDRPGIDQRQSVLRAATKPRHRPVENRRLSSLSQARLDLRHPLPFHLGGPCRAWPPARCGRVSALGRRGAVPAATGSDQRRCRLRLRTESLFCASSMASARSYRPLSDGRPTNPPAAATVG